MSVIPVDDVPRAAEGASGPGSFWQKLTQTLDQYLVDRTKRAVPDFTLRRSKHDIARCRRLMQQSATVPVKAAPGNRRVAQARSR